MLHIKCCVFFLWPVNHVTLSFTDFELEIISSNCSHDAVEILDGDNYQAPSIGTFTFIVCACASVRIMQLNTTACSFTWNLIKAFKCNIHFWQVAIVALRYLTRWHPSVTPWWSISSQTTPSPEKVSEPPTRLPHQVRDTRIPCSVLDE